MLQIYIQLNVYKIYIHIQYGKTQGYVGDTYIDKLHIISKKVNLASQLEIIIAIN